MVVVVVLRKTGDGHGVLSLHALAARTTVEAGVGQELDATVLLCLKANRKVFHNLRLGSSHAQEDKNKKHAVGLQKRHEMSHRLLPNTKSRSWVVFFLTFCEISSIECAGLCLLLTCSKPFEWNQR